MFKKAEFRPPSNKSKAMVANCRLGLSSAGAGIITTLRGKIYVASGATAHASDVDRGSAGAV